MPAANSFTMMLPALLSLPSFFISSNTPSTSGMPSGGSMPILSKPSCSSSSSIALLPSASKCAATVSTLRCRAWQCFRILSNASLPVWSASVICVFISNICLNRRSIFSTGSKLRSTRNEMLICAARLYCLFTIFLPRLSRMSYQSSSWYGLPIAPCSAASSDGMPPPTPVRPYGAPSK